jgi:hypothetical protein
MPQKVLLPSDKPPVGQEWRPTGPIPAALRQFGKFPNIEQWLPADLLLVSSLEPDRVTKQIIVTQERGGFSVDFTDRCENCQCRALAYIALDRCKAMSVLPQKLRVVLRSFTDQLAK